MSVQSLSCASATWLRRNPYQLMLSIEKAVQLHRCQERMAKRLAEKKSNILSLEEAKVMKKRDKMLMELGSKATIFGLGLLAAKKLRPYAKYFIIGGVAATALPGVMAAVEQIKAKRSAEQTVEEVQVEQAEGCCEQEPTPEATTSSGEAACCKEEAATPCPEEAEVAECKEK
jgi:hypothetical protein